MLDSEATNEHWNHQLMKQEDFMGLAKMSMKTDLEMWFKTLCTLSAEDRLLFDQSIQQIHANLFKTYCENIKPRKGNRKEASTFHKTVYLGAIKKASTKTFMMVPALRNEKAMMLLLLTLSRGLFDRLLAFHQRRILLVKAGSSVPDINKEVNRFVGWAISELQRLHTKEHADTGEANEESQEHWDLLDAMGYSHQEAVMNTEYMEKYYEPFDMLNNRGKLVLVHPDFYSCATNLMTAVAAAVTELKLTTLGPVLAAAAAAGNDDDDARRSCCPVLMYYRRVLLPD